MPAAPLPASGQSRSHSVFAAAVTHAKQASAFLIIGGLAFVVDAAVFNVLVYWASRGPLFEQPLTAKIIAIVVASVVTYFGNRLWTFRSRKTPGSMRQYLLFALFNTIAILLQLACLAFSRYVLGLQDPVSDNVSGTLIGQALATVFRYFTYDHWIFPPSRPGEENADEDRLT